MMKIPQEIQDLMPEREQMFDPIEDVGFQCAYDEWLAALPQMLALAEKRGAEVERETLRVHLEREVIDPILDETKSFGKAKIINTLRANLTKP